jgi:hypothetical protein
MNLYIITLLLAFSYLIAIFKIVVIKFYLSLFNKININIFMKNV